MIQHYLITAFRNLKKNGLFTFINLTGLSIGLACCLLLFLYVKNELSYDQFHQHAATIFRVTTLQNNNGEKDAIATTPSPLAATLQKDIPGITAVTRIGKWHANFKTGNAIFEEANIYAVDPAFLSVFSFPLQAGSAALQNDNVIVLTENSASRYFGADWKTKNIIGQSIAAKAGAAEYLFTVEGVLKNVPANSTLQFDFLIPFHVLETFDNSQNQWNYSSYYTYIQAGKNAALPLLQTQIQHQFAKYVPNASTLLQVQPLPAVYLHSDFAFNSDFIAGGDLTYLQICIAIGCIILLLSCINFVNLTTARAAKRAKEIGMRKTIGASRKQLIVQFIFEASLLCAIALLSALVLVQLSLPYFQTLCGKQLSVRYDFTYCMILLAFYCFTVILSGFYPAFFLSSFPASKVIKSVFTASKSKRFREAMLLFQFAVSIVMIVCAITITQQLQYLQSKDLGFDKNQLLYIKLKSPEVRKNYRLLQHDIQQQTGINKVSAATANLVDVSNGGDVQWQGMQSSDAFSITQITVDENFLAATGMQMAQGRNFSSRLPSDSTAFIINETAAQKMNFDKKAIGKVLTFWGVTGSIIGVVKDFNYQPLTTAVQPLLLRYRPEEWHSALLIKTKPGSIQPALSAIQSLYKKYDPDAAYEYGFVDQQLNKLYAGQQRTGKIVNCFALLAILISCLGLLSLVAYTVEQRTKEIGIRKILGASFLALFRLLSGEFMRPVYIALIIAIPAGYFLAGKWLQHFVYRITISWQVFALTIFVSVFLALLTISFQAIKAAIANPVMSLRTE